MAASPLSSQTTAIPGRDGSRHAAEPADDLRRQPAVTLSARSSSWPTRHPTRRTAVAAPAGPITSVISPFGGSANRLASSAAVPRTTSSNRLVSSRHTAAGRAGSNVARLASAAGSRLGDRRPPRATAMQRAGPTATRAPSPRGAGSRATGTGHRRARSRRAPSRPRRGPAAPGPRARGRQRPDQPCPGIVDPGEARVADERDALALLDQGQHLGRPARLAVSLVARAALDSVASEKDARVRGCPRRGRGRPRAARGGREASRPRDFRSGSRTRAGARLLRFGVSRTPWQEAMTSPLNAALTNLHRRDPPGPAATLVLVARKEKPYRVYRTPRRVRGAPSRLCRTATAVRRRSRRAAAEASMGRPPRDRAVPEPLSSSPSALRAASGRRRRGSARDVLGRARHPVAAARRRGMGCPVG